MKRMCEERDLISERDKQQKDYKYERIDDEKT